MPCDSKKNTINYLKSLNVLGEQSVILNLEEFNRLNGEYTKEAKSTYKLDFSGNIFNVSKVKFEGKTVYVAESNDNIFKTIDKYINEDFDDNNYYSTPNTENKIVPFYDKYIAYKKNLITQLEKLLANLEKDIKDNSANLSKVKVLVAKKQQVLDRLEGTEDIGDIGLKEEISLLDKKPSIDELKFYIEKDLSRLDTLMSTDSLENYKEAQKIINFYKAMGTFHSSEKHPLFYEQKVSDIDGSVQIFNTWDDGSGKNILPQSTIDMFTNIRKKVEEIESTLYRKTENLAVETFNSDSGVRRTYGDKIFTAAEIFSKEKGRQDINWVDMFVMDITNGIFTDDGELPQVMLTVLQNSMNSNLVYSKGVEKRVDTIQDDVVKVLKSMGYGIGIPGIKGAKYDIFRASKDVYYSDSGAVVSFNVSHDENGKLKKGFTKKSLFKDSIVQRYSPEYFDKRTEMLGDFNKQLKAANNGGNFNTRQTLRKSAFNFRNNWLDKNTYILEAGNIPEIINDSQFSEFKEYFASNKAEGYKNFLVNQLGEFGYKEEVDKQIKLLKSYKVALEVKKEGLLAQENVEKVEDLPNNILKHLHIWKQTNNPFVAASIINDKKEIHIDGIQYHSFMNYNYTIPRKNKAKLVVKGGKLVKQETQESTGYFDENFKVIEGNSTLKDFHNILQEVNNKIYEHIPLNRRSDFNIYSIPKLEKTIYEILASEEYSFLTKISKIYAATMNRIKDLIGITPQNTLSYVPVDPITGKPEYKVNDGFLKTNKKEIETRLNLELDRIKMALNFPPNMKLGSLDTWDLTAPYFTKEAIAIIAESMGIKPNIKALQKRLPDLNIKAVDIYKIVKAGITDQVVRENSFDLPKIIKLFSHLTMEYKARTEVKPLLEIMKSHYEEIKKPDITNLGETLINARTKETRLDGIRENANRRMDSWFKRSVLGNYGNQNELGDTRINPGETGFTGIEQIDKLTTMLQTTVTGKLKKTNEKVLEKKIDDLLLQYESVLNDKNVSDEIKEAFEQKKAILREQKSKLGKDFTIITFIDGVLNWIRLMGLGWNLSSHITNFLEGQVGNIIGASTGKYFKPEHIYRANHIVKGSFIKNLTLGNYVSEGAKKTTILMGRYRILQDAANELQQASDKSNFDRLIILNPYDGTRRVEYLNQAPLMIAILLSTEIVGLNGEKTNVWDALDSDGKLLAEYRTKENIANWENADGDKFNTFAVHTSKTIKNIHGDYHELSGNLASEFVAGKTMLMFKRWMARQFYQRFATEQADIELGIKDYEGRFKSHNTSSGMLHGMIIGGAGLGVIGSGGLGLILGGIIGGGLGKFYGKSTNLSFAHELLFTIKQLALEVIKIPVNNLTGKQIVKDNDYQALRDKKVSERTIRNLRANLVDMGITLSWIALLIFIKAALFDEEDEKEDLKRQTHNLLVNRLMQMSGQATMYVNPKAVYDSTIGGLPLIRFVDNLGKTLDKATQALRGDDIIPTGINAGESALVNQASKTFLPGVFRDGLGFETHMERQFKPSYFDRWFKSQEGLAGKEVKRIRARYRNKLKNQGKSKTEIKKLVKQKYRNKKKTESYQDLLDSYQR